MLKIYNNIGYVSIDDGATWKMTSIFNTKIEEEHKDKEKIIFLHKSWKEIWNETVNKPYEYWWPFYTDTIKIPFKKDKKPFIDVPFCNNDIKHRYYDTDNVFFSYKIVHQEIDCYTLFDIIKKFPADEVIQYLKEHGLNVCPIEL